MAGKQKEPGVSVTPIDHKTTAIAPAPAFDESLLHEDAQQSLGFRKEDLALAFLRVAQSNSPELKKTEGKFIKGLEQGMFFNSVTQQYWEGEEAGVWSIPIQHAISVIEWRPRTQGGGIVRDYGEDESILRQTTKNDRNKDVLANGNEIVVSNLYYTFHVDPETGLYWPEVIGFASTQRKKAKKWNSMIAGAVARDSSGSPFRPAPFYYAYNLVTVPESNEQGSWYGVSVKAENPKPVAVIALPNGSDIYLAARDYRKLITAGAIKATPVADDAEIVEEDEEEDGKRLENTPF